MGGSAITTSIGQNLAANVKNGDGTSIYNGTTGDWTLKNASGVTNFNVTQFYSQFTRGTTILRITPLTSTVYLDALGADTSTNGAVEFRSARSNESNFVTVGGYTGAGAWTLGSASSTANQQINGSLTAVFGRTGSAWTVNGREDGTVTRQYVYGPDASTYGMHEFYTGKQTTPAYIKSFYYNSVGIYNAANSTVWNTTSDLRVKDNIRPITDALGKINALNPVHFEYKHKLGVTKTSFIAQEFAEVLPNHVIEMPCPSEVAEVCPELAEGNILGLDCDLIPYLTKAIQEQSAIIESLKSRISSLESR